MELNKESNDGMRSFGRRSRLNIMASILSLCSKKITQKTHIMYFCNLSYDQLQRYLEFLIRMGLLEVVKNEDMKECYKTTESGKEFLGLFNKLKDFLSEDQKKRI